MRHILRIVAILLLSASFLWWSSAGSNKGWTKTSVQVWNYDEITEISYPTTVDRFVPGIDFLAGGTALSLLLLGVSFIFRKRQTLNPSTH
jgi:hypothetical protein